MKRIICVVISLCISLSIISGCGNSSNTDAYENAAREFITAMYTYEKGNEILDQEELGSELEKHMEYILGFMTEEKYGRAIIGTREAFYSIYAGFFNKSVITVKNIDLQHLSKVSETGALVYKYTAIVNSTPFGGGKVTEFELTGQIQVVKAGKGYKIKDIFSDGDSKWFEFSRRRNN